MKKTKEAKITKNVKKFLISPVNFENTKQKDNIFEIMYFMIIVV